MNDNKIYDAPQAEIVSKKATSLNLVAHNSCQVNQILIWFKAALEMLTEDFIQWLFIGVILGGILLGISIVPIAGKYLVALFLAFLFGGLVKEYGNKLAGNGFKARNLTHLPASYVKPLMSLAIIYMLLNVFLDLIFSHAPDIIVDFLSYYAFTVSVDVQNILKYTLLFFSFILNGLTLLMFIFAVFLVTLFNSGFKEALQRSTKGVLGNKLILSIYWLVVMGLSAVSVLTVYFLFLDFWFLLLLIILLPIDAACSLMAFKAIFTQEVRAEVGPIVNC